MANSLDAFVPELWANESVAILLESMVIGSLVHKDFNNEVASFGDTVNTRQPAEFTAKRKTAADSVTVQNADATNIPVVLNQHFHTTFLIKDEEASKSFKDLVATYLQPAVASIGQAVDKVLLGQAHQFYANTAGGLGQVSDTNIKGYILDTRKKLNENKAHVTGRNMIMSPNTETEALKLDTFTEADKVGDAGGALREAMLGRKFQFDMYMAQNVPSVTGATNATASTALVDLAAGYAAGTTVVHVDTAGSSMLVGQFLKFAGDNTPYQVTTLGSLVTQDIDVTITPALKNAIVDDAAVTVYANGEVDLAAGYAVGYAKEIVIDGFATTTLEVGQAIAFGTDATKYSIIDFTLSGTATIGITLDRPLEVALADNDNVYTGVAGDYNFAFHRNALTFVSRPLAAAPAGMGASSAVANFSNLGIRVTMTYDGTQQGILVTVDLLCGVKVLDANLGALMLG